MRADYFHSVSKGSFDRWHERGLAQQVGRKRRLASPEKRFNYCHTIMSFLLRFSNVFNLLLFCALLSACSISAAGAASDTRANAPVPSLENKAQKKYPQSWDINIIPETKLKTLAQIYSGKDVLLPPDDLSDPLPLPKWFRAYLREKLIGLPTKGRPQYPREAEQLLGWLEKNQDYAQDELDSRIDELQQKVPSVKKENERRAKYPTAWEVAVPPNTKLDKLRKRLDAQFYLLPQRDLDDTSALPIWFRVYLRKQHPELTKSGPYQYPRTAGRILQWMLDHPNADEIDSQQQ